MNEMSVEKRWNEICGRGKWEKPRENLPRPRFVNDKTHGNRDASLVSILLSIVEVVKITMVYLQCFLQGMYKK